MMFKKYPLTIIKPIEICVDEVLIDEENINYTNKMEEFEHGESEICEIKSGTKLWGAVNPNGCIDIFQTEEDSICIKSDAKLGTDFNWNYIPNIIPTKKQSKRRGM